MDPIFTAHSHLGEMVIIVDNTFNSYLRTRIYREEWITGEDTKLLKFITKEHGEFTVKTYFIIVIPNVM